MSCPPPTPSKGGLFAGVIFKNTLSDKVPLWRGEGEDFTHWKFLQLPFRRQFFWPSPLPFSGLEFEIIGDGRNETEQTDLRIYVTAGAVAFYFHFVRLSLVVHVVGANTPFALPFFMWLVFPYQVQIQTVRWRKFQGVAIGVNGHYIYAGVRWFGRNVLAQATGKTLAGAINPHPGNA